MSPSLKDSIHLDQPEAPCSTSRLSAKALALAAAFSALAQSACTTELPRRDRAESEAGTSNSQDGGVSFDATASADGSFEEDATGFDAQTNDTDALTGDAASSDATQHDAQIVDAQSNDGDPLCFTTEEICDGQDNNCDGQIDESFPQDNCSVGVGACEQMGVQLCEDGTVVCSAQAGEPGAEICNGIDDDCDGQTDEGHLYCAQELTIACPGPDRTNRMCAINDANEVTHCIPEEEGCGSLDDDQDLRVLNLDSGERAIVITTRQIERTDAPLRLLTAQLPLEISCAASQARHIEAGDHVGDLVAQTEAMEPTRVYDSITEYAVDTAEIAGGQGICLIGKRP